MTEAINSLQQDQLRTRLRHATYTIALLAATNATKHQIRAQGLKLSQFRACDLRTRAEQYLSDHRETLLSEGRGRSRKHLASPKVVAHQKGKS